jgi:hypothetical protein
MTYTEEELDFIQAISNDSVDEVRRIIETHPRLRTELLDSGEPVMCHFAVSPSEEIFQFGLTLGLDLNVVGLPPYRGETALVRAIHKKKHARVQRLLEFGADPNINRPIIAAVHQENSTDEQIFLLELLLKHGANINQLFDLYGDHDKSFSVLDWCEVNQVREFLIQRGALHSKEIKRLQASGVTVDPAAPEAVKSREETVIDFFESKYGSVDPRSIQEIVTSELPIAIHIIPPSTQCEWLTLFTTGMSEHRMRIPNGSLTRPQAELFMQLPANWPYRQLDTMEFAWPMAWLRKLARYPKSRGLTLDSPASFVKLPLRAELALGLSYTGFMLLAELEIKQNVGQPIAAYRVFPLFAEEFQLQQREGTPTVLRSLNKSKLSLVLSNDRLNAGVSY